MSKIIRIVVLSISILIPFVVFADDTKSNNQVVEMSTIKILGNKDIINLADSRIQLSKNVLQFKTKQEEKIEKNNKKRLNIYKKKLERSKFQTGDKKILITGYSSTPDQCSGNPFITASGTHVHQGTMACPAQYSFGTKIKISGIGTFICEDRGGAIKGNHFDMWFTSRQKALAWGKRILVATITK